MPISVGDTLPEASFLKFGADGPETIDLKDRTAGKKTVFFALPGAFSRTCSASHMPSFVRNADAIRAKGVDHIVCVTVNDPFVTKAWGEATGADAAGIEILADADASYTKAVDMLFSGAPVGLFDRSKRYSMLVEDGKVTVLQAEENVGECTVTAGETLLEAI